MNYQIFLEDLFRAYYNARSNKRNTINALQFEYNYERELLKLYKEIIEKKYVLKPSICFINKYPVKREIFAADFRDRVIHHLIYNYINHIFDRIFIYDVYSCRKGKGTLCGIKRLDHFIRSCSQNYQKNCYILKLDISGYFMSIDKRILYNKVENILAEYRHYIKNIDLNLLLYLIRKVIFNDPTKDCRIKGRKENWDGLPKNKSLFYSAQGKGLPIGNLTSQLFSNVYLNDFDHHMKRGLGCKRYGRYVDDFFIVSTDKIFLKKTIKQADDYLKRKLGLKVHKKKIYLQHFTKGVTFLGANIKPFRIYIKNNTKGNLYKTIYDWNKALRKNGYKPTREEILYFVSRINSYLGIMGHFKTKKLRSIAIKKINTYSFHWFYIADFTNKCLRIRDRVKDGVGW